MSKIIEQLDKETEKFRDEMIDRLNDLLLPSIIIPFCQKYKLEFLSGNGDFWFRPIYTENLMHILTFDSLVRSSNIYPEATDWDYKFHTNDEFMNTLKKIEDFLNLDFPANSQWCIGSCLNDYHYNTNSHIKEIDFSVIE